jgi:hypothetical protein
MTDIRESPSASPSDNKVIFHAESVAGDLWMRQHYHGIHLELGTQEASAFTQSAKDAGLVIEKLLPAGSSSDTDLAH